MPGEETWPRLAEPLLRWADRSRHWLLGVMVLLYLAGFNGQWRIEPDGALYLSIARNLAGGEGYSYHGQPHHLAYPGLPYLLAATFKIFGSDTLWPAHVLMLLMGLAALALIYRLMRLHAGRPVAVLVTCGVGVTRIFFIYAFYLMTDMPFVVGVMAFLAGYEGICRWGTAPTSAEATCEAAPHTARWFDWALLLVGLGIAVATRPVMWGLLLAIGVTAAWSMFTRRLGWQRIVIGLTAVAVLLAFVLCDPRRSGGQSLGDYEQIATQQITHGPALMHQVLTRNLPNLLEPLACDTIFGIRLLPGLNSLMGVTAIGLGIALIRRRVLWGLWVAVTILMMALLVQEDRYFLPILPLLVYGWWCGLAWLNRRLPHPWCNWLFVPLLLLGIVPNLIRVGGLIVAQHQRPFLEYYKDGRYVPLMKMAEEIHRRVGSSAVVVAPYKTARMLSYVSQRQVVEKIEEPQIDPAQQEVYVVLPRHDRQQRRELKEFLARLSLQVDLAGQASLDPSREDPPLLLCRTKPLRGDSHTPGETGPEHAAKELQVTPN